MDLEKRYGSKGEEVNILQMVKREPKRRAKAKEQWYVVKCSKCGARHSVFGIKPRRKVGKEG